VYEGVSVYIDGHEQDVASQEGCRIEARSKIVRAWGRWECMHAPLANTTTFYLAIGESVSRYVLVSVDDPNLGQ